MVGLLEGHSKKVLQRLGPRETVRLEHDDHALVRPGARCGESGSDLRGMMAVVIDHNLARAAVKNLEPTACPPKCFERGGDFFKGNADLRSEGDGGEGIEGVVSAGNVEDDLSEDFVVSLNAEIGAEIFGRQIDESVTGRRRMAIGNGAGIFGANAGGPFVIGAVDNVAGGLRDEPLVDGVDGVEILVIIQVLGLDVEHDRVARMVVHQRPVALIPLGDKIRTLGIPAGVRSENGNFGPDIVRRFESPGTKQVGGHRGGGGLAVHSTNHDALLRGHHRREGIRATNHRNPQPRRLVIGGISRSDGGGVNNEIGAANAFRRVRTGKAQALFGKPLDLDRVDLVGTADIVPKPEQKRGDAAHAGTRHADEVDFRRSRTGQKVAEFFGSHFIPSATARSMTSATLAAADSGESPRAAAAIAARRSGFPSNFETAVAKTSGWISLSLISSAAPARTKISAFAFWWSSVA